MTAGSTGRSRQTRECVSGHSQGSLGGQGWRPGAVATEGSHQV